MFCKVLCISIVVHTSRSDMRELSLSLQGAQACALPKRQITLVDEMKHVPGYEQVGLIIRA